MTKGIVEASVSYKPFKHPWAMQFAEASEKAHWGSWEVDLQTDVEQIKRGVITPVELEQIRQILRLFTQTDVVVGGNYSEKFIPALKNNEVRNMLLSFANREGTHQRSYALLNDTIGMPESEYSEFLNVEAMSEKVEFMQQSDITTTSGLGLTIAQTVCNEGMSLFSAFAMLINYERSRKMKGMCEVIEWSIRDETLHVMGMSQLFHEYCKENPEIVTDDFKYQIYEMFRNAVALEDAVIDLAYVNGPVADLDAETMKQFIRYIANRRLNGIGLKNAFEVEENPLPWIETMISGASMKNFFEGRVTNYSHDSFVGNWW